MQRILTATGFMSFGVVRAHGSPGGGWAGAIYFSLFVAHNLAYVQSPDARVNPKYALVIINY